MPITKMLSMNAKVYPNKTSLIERDPALGIRREITWLEFDNGGVTSPHLWTGI